MPEFPSRPYALQRGELVQICTEVGNHGDADLRDVELRFVTYGDNPVSLHSRRIDEMSPNDSADYCARVTIPADSLRFIAGVYFDDWNNEARPSDNKVEYEFATGATYGGNQSVEDAPLLQPDLEIVRFELADERCTAGRNRVLVTVRNSGEGPSRHSSVELLIDSGDILSKSVGRLKPGEEETVRFEREDLSAGRHNMLATADPEGEIDERSENNNERFLLGINCLAAVADLEVDSIGLDDRECTAGRNRIIAAVRNYGSARADRFLVRLFVNGVEMDDVELDDLPVGDMKRARFNGVVLGTGQQTLRVHADVRDSVDEDNEGNNRLEVGFNCIAEPPRRR
jgi:subtilase family serine protease